MKNAAAINGFLIRTKNLSNEISFFIQYNYNTILKFNYHCLKNKIEPKRDFFVISLKQI